MRQLCENLLIYETKFRQINKEVDLSIIDVKSSFSDLQSLTPNFFLHFLDKIFIFLWKHISLKFVAQSSNSLTVQFYLFKPLRIHSWCIRQWWINVPLHLKHLLRGGRGNCSESEIREASIAPSLSSSLFPWGLNPWKVSIFLFINQLSSSIRKHEKIKGFLIDRWCIPSQLEAFWQTWQDWKHKRVHLSVCLFGQESSGGLAFILLAVQKEFHNLKVPIKHRPNCPLCSKRA